ncbi:hypothetical protein ABWK29_20360 [Priestia megaterium]|uniref:Uncharacterized protein n=1 Tax=Priestia megaterium TaxID=1404 RepID=A0AAE5P9G8_PRIMG|nr:hypothetical protein [Priestia megaterium]RFB22992.1 hypothetical protein DZB87_22765 [Bacillus sp. ALD]MED3968531.1 hypothetical protein [Priestia megaterium]PES42483.1 hypothetical protein CN497_00830 [Priestia megaterium]PFE37555.1 hypothetical protein CN270_01685 [Priestia megaterium]PFJ42853.1 hypothetical protein COJ00_19795 [Priestia megaterium]
MKSFAPLPYYWPPYYMPHPYTYRVPNLPEADIATFQQSLKVIPSTMQSATIFIQRANTSPNLIKKIKAAAQESKMSEVKRLILSTGVKTKIDVFYTPDYIKITFIHPDNQFDCCHVSLNIRW